MVRFQITPAALKHIEGLKTIGPMVRYYLTTYNILYTPNRFISVRNFLIKKLIKAGHDVYKEKIVNPKGTYKQGRRVTKEHGKKGGKFAVKDTEGPEHAKYVHNAMLKKATRIPNYSGSYGGEVVDR
jgi:hypothetical protein